MEFRILGPLELLVEGRNVTPPQAKRRALLALLLLHANEPVSSDVLIHALWGEQPPPTALTALHGHVSAIRKLVGAERIETQAAGYLLLVKPGEVDADRFEELLAHAGRNDEPAERSARLAAALTLWRGEALSDFRYDDFARAETARLEERRLAAVEEQFEAELALGRHRELLAELERLVAEHPHRERLRAQLMLALYRSGRQSEALHVFQEGRRVLADEIGIDPGPALRALERQILVQDPELEPPRSSETAVARQERKRVTVLVAELSGPSDPEELEILLGPALARAREVVTGYGAVVQPLFSNALMGIFGAPRAYEDDTERAVRAGAALVEAISNEGRLEIRVGIERGEALVTIKGGQVEVTGEVVTAALRLQTTASANTVALGKSLRRARATREGREAPFVGRRHELGILEHTHGRVVGENAVQLVTILGEPGSGKTRLTREFAAFLEMTESHTWLAGRCLPYGDGVSFWALGEIVKGSVGILESDDAETSTRKLAETLSVLLPESDRAWVEAGLAPLVGVARSPTATREESFQAWRLFLETLAASEPLVLLIEDLHWADPALLEFVDTLVERAADVPLLVLATARLELLDRRPDWASGKRTSTTVTLPPLTTDETRELARALLGGNEPSEAVVARSGGNPLFVQELTRIDVTEADALPESLDAVIAARLDTLPPAVKQTAMDAAVIGETFWPGAVAAISGIEESEVEERLRRLDAGDVVRRAWTSSVQGQDEHAFLHVVVRDVAYEQIPKTHRAQKHVSAGAWIEQLAGERVIDHAELIAHHYAAALEYGAAEDDANLRAKTRHFLTLAGDRALQLDITAAERFYRRSLALVPDGHADGHLLEQLARAATEAGRLDEAERLYEQAMGAMRAGGEDARALAGAGTELFRVLWRRGKNSEARGILSEALRVLDREHPGRELSAAYLLMALTHTMAGRPSRGIRWAERAIAMADELGLRHRVVHALQFRGLARCSLNDLGGLDDLREALRLGLGTAATSETGIAYNHLAEWTALTEGPEPSLELYAAGIDFLERRGFEFLAQWLRMETLAWLFELGRWNELLALTKKLVTWDRSQGESQITAISLAHQGTVIIRRGSVAEAKLLVDSFLDSARAIADDHVLTRALACAALVARACRDDVAAIEHLEELEAATGDSDAVFRVLHLPDAARVCAVVGVLEPAKRMVSNLDVVAPALTYRVLSARAVLAEADGRVDEALAGYTEAASRWCEFGNVVEEAYALLGRGRCLLRLDRNGEAAEPLGAARTLFERLDARPLVAEVDEELAQAGAIA